MPINHHTSFSRFPFDTKDELEISVEGKDNTLCLGFKDKGTQHWAIPPALAKAILADRQKMVMGMRNQLLGLAVKGAVDGT